MVKFKDIEKFLQSTCNYQVTIEWGYLETVLADYAECEALGASFELNPDFQRGHVWELYQQIEYVEFILRGGQSGHDIYFNHPGWHGGEAGHMVLVDGLQRITAVRAFMNNDIPAFGSFYRDYTDKLRAVQCRFNFHINNLKTREDVLKWYLQMNTGGIVHTKEELNRVKKLLNEELEK